MKICGAYFYEKAPIYALSCPANSCAQQLDFSTLYDRVTIFPQERSEVVKKYNGVYVVVSLIVGILCTTHKLFSPPPGSIRSVSPGMIRSVSPGVIRPVSPTSSRASHKQPFFWVQTPKGDLVLTTLPLQEQLRATRSLMPPRTTFERQQFRLSIPELMVPQHPPLPAQPIQTMQQAALKRFGEFGITPTKQDIAYALHLATLETQGMFQEAQGLFQLDDRDIFQTIGKGTIFAQTFIPDPSDPNIQPLSEYTPPKGLFHPAIAPRKRHPGRPVRAWGSRTFARAFPEEPDKAREAEDIYQSALLQAGRAGLMVPLGKNGLTRPNLKQVIITGIQEAPLSEVGVQGKYPSFGRQALQLFYY